ncbi:hypothetical protein [Mycobacterium paraterrae]|uniref:Uncharacterized protein n=1 Tax=Mycobacterium paraterrae TaxID=577492 RepID=A0ABY3VKV5_9MYCO|nr:hypothetical protein [Mycobacterium paraterrae]UMB70049.1 hypothetical protein MKK62_01440 [Mycobacterium paraterrae]
MRILLDAACLTPPNAADEVTRVGRPWNLCAKAASVRLPAPALDDPWDRALTAVGNALYRGEHPSLADRSESESQLLATVFIL